MAKRPSRGWTLLVLAENNANHRQFRVSRGLVFSLIAVVACITLAAVTASVMLWQVAKRADQVEPLRQRILELEASQEQLERMGEELADLQNFSARLQRVLTGASGDTSMQIPWPKSDNASLLAQIESGIPAGPDEPVNAGWQLPAELSFASTSMPTYPPVRGYITREFTTAGPYTFGSHEGLDIAAREGTPILAAASGIVLFSGWTYPYGKLIVVSHSSGYTTFYGHNQTCLVNAGDSVLQGQPIGLLGNSGRSSAPHLHFEIWQGDQTINPLTLLKPES